MRRDILPHVRKIEAKTDAQKRVPTEKLFCRDSILAVRQNKHKVNCHNDPVLLFLCVLCGGVLSLRAADICGEINSWLDRYMTNHPK